MMFRSEASETWNFGCGYSDFSCKMAESTANTLADVLRWVLDISLGSQGFVPGDTLWIAATNEAGQWFGLAIVGMLIATVVGLSVAALRSDGNAIKRTLFGMLASIAATVFAVFVVGKGLELADEISEGTLDRLTHGENGFAGMVLELLMPPETNEQLVSNTATQAIATTPGVVIVLLVVFVLGLLIMTAAVAFRNFILMILIAFAPLAFVMLPHKGGEVWVRRWASATVAMLLAKPLIFGTLAMLMATMGDIRFGDGAVVTVGIGIIISGFMPMLAYGFFSFLGGSGAQLAGDGIGSQVSAKAQQGVRAVTSRVSGAAGRAGGARAGGSPAVPATPGAVPVPQTASGGGGASSQYGGTATPGGGGSVPTTPRRGGQTPTVGGNSPTPRSGASSAPTSPGAGAGAVAPPVPPRVPTPPTPSTSERGGGQAT